MPYGYGENQFSRAVLRRNVRLVASPLAKAPSVFQPLAQERIVSTWNLANYMPYAMHVGSTPPSTTWKGEYIALQQILCSEAFCTCARLRRVVGRLRSVPYMRAPGRAPGWRGMLREVYNPQISRSGTNATWRQHVGAARARAQPRGQRPYAQPHVAKGSCT